MAFRDREGRWVDLFSHEFVRGSWAWFTLDGADRSPFTRTLHPCGYFFAPGREDFDREPAKEVGPAGGEVKTLERFTGLCQTLNVPPHFGSGGLCCARNY
jgi:hypothetical protein